MPHHIASQVISPIPELERSHSLGSRGRKMSSTGGNRSWSEEEVRQTAKPKSLTKDPMANGIHQENYLLQTRMQKMPYKHIAAHLKKTELACRLHYHQLSHGSHRRKRTGSVSSSNSHGSVSSNSSGSSPRSQYHLGYGHEDDHHDMGYGAVRYGVNTSPSYNSHKVLLPKPMPLTPPEHNDHNALRINTSMGGDNVDHTRLRAIYDQHRSTFWNAIAQEYGQDVSPAQLESIWRHDPTQGFPGMMRPPTPGDSPDRLGRPTLKPSPFPLYNPYATTDYRTNSNPLNMHSAVGVPDRMNFGFPPTPDSAYTRAPLGRANTWGSASYPTSAQAPTAIASLLTENKCPRGRECTGPSCTSGHGHC